MSESTIMTLADLPEDFPIPSSPQTSGSSEESPSTLKQIVRRRTQSLERELIEKALEETGGNVTRAAEKLGLGLKRPFDLSVSQS
jgi:two-component system, NtrC family, response regulator AtoC